MPLQSDIILIIISYLVPPPIPQSYMSDNEKATICYYPLYSQDPLILESMIREQAAYPPNFAVRLRGTHTETFRTRDQKTERKTVVDFDIRVNMTHLLVCPNPVHSTDTRPCDVIPQPLRRQSPAQGNPAPSCKYMKLLGFNEKGYRGTIIKSRNMSSSDPEASMSLTSWCNAYVSDQHAVKNFILRRQIVGHDPERLETLCRDLVQRTSYRGHTSITFETTHEEVKVCSPCFINNWRYNVFLVWFCLVTFLWIFTWPILFFPTKRYEVVTAIFPYRLDPTGNSVGRPLVQSEDVFFNEWKQALTRAVLAQHQGWVDAIYREETAQLARAGNNMVTVQSPQNNLQGFVAGAVRVALGMPTATGWGADS